MFERFRRLPHHELIFAGAIALLFLAFIIYDRKPWEGFGSMHYVSGTSTISAVERFLVDIDSDHDGLPDWKETLYHTDPNNPDTDGDRTSDGQEVFEGRDPTKPNTASKGAAPNDKLPFIAAVESASSASIDDARRRFLSAFLTGRSMSIQEQTVRDLVKQFDPNQYRERYAADNLRVVPDASAQTLRDYGNAFGALIDKYTARTHRSEDEIIDDALRAKDDATKSTSILQELDYPAASYKNFAADLAKIPVPASLSQSHLLIVNGYDVMSRGLVGMKDMYANPVNGAAGYQAFTKYRYQVTYGYASLVKAFAQNGVIFARQDPGGAFTWTPSTSTPAMWINAAGTPKTRVEAPNVSSTTNDLLQLENLL